MDQVNRRSVLVLGAAAAAGLVALPLTSSTASAEEHRYHKIHEAFVALKAAKEEIEATSHDWGGRRKEAIESINRAMVHLEIMRDYK